MIVKALRVGLGQLIVFLDWVSRPRKLKRDAAIQPFPAAQQPVARHVRQTHDATGCDPRIEFTDREIAGRSPNTLDSTAAQTVGVGGSFRLSPNLNVTAGVRYQSERDRLVPLTDGSQDSQAVYVGTQFRF